MENLITSVQDLLASTSGTLAGIALIMAGIACIIILLLIIFFIRIYIAYYMAKKRHRDPLAWALLSFFVSPILTWILLLILGDAN
ncbi:MAG: hypothetical protein IJS82_06530 [Paludibacteraceae bacterium]|nr:hypothetical protein [Paludibacteraceae bacterium]